MDGIYIVTISALLWYCFFSNRRHKLLMIRVERVEEANMHLHFERIRIADRSVLQAPHWN